MKSGREGEGRALSGPWFQYGGQGEEYIGRDKLPGHEAWKTFKAMSSVIETEPWGFETESRFLNAVVLYELEFRDGYNAQAEG